MPLDGPPREGPHDGGMKVELCSEGGREGWDAFVRSQPDGSHYQLFGWKQVIERTYGHDCPYLHITRDGVTRGILPLCKVTSRVFGRSLTSLPYLDSAGVETPHEEVREALLARAFEICHEQSLDYLEVRQTHPLAGEFRVDTRKVSLTMELQGDTGRQWEALPSERRNRVRKAQKAGLRPELGGAALLPEFYRVWSQNMRDLGSPAHSLRWFEHVLENFADSAHLLLIRGEQGAVGAALLLRYNDMMSVPWVSSLRAAFAHHPNDLLYWSSIEIALGQGCRSFDFGRSTEGSGNYTYKMRWGATARSLYWHYGGRRGKKPALPDADDQRFRLATWLWKRLPVKLANRIGPGIRSGITR